MGNKTVLILGSSSDIGVQTARMFLEKKWKLIGHYNKSKKKMVYLQKKYGTQIKLFQLDLSNPKNRVTTEKADHLLELRPSGSQIRLLFLYYQKD